MSMWSRQGTAGAAAVRAAAAALRLPVPGNLRGGGFAGALGAVRTKKWKPFHNMYRNNHLREKRRKLQEEQALAGEEGGAPGASSAVAREGEPQVSTTPFQAARLLRAFDVIPEKDAAIEFWTKMNVDLTRESVRGTCHLPHGLDQKIKVLAFCLDDEADEMLAAGADIAGITEVSRRINQGWLGFDRCLATPMIMPQVMKVAKVLGPRRMMPNPKSGTVVTNLKQAIREAKGGTLLEYRAEGEGELRATIGDANFSDAKVLENLKFLVQTLLRARPRGSAGGGGGGAKSGGGMQGLPLIGALKDKAKEEKDGPKDEYFLEAVLRLAPNGPPIRLDPESMLPASVGYFR